MFVFSLANKIKRETLEFRNYSWEYLIEKSVISSLRCDFCKCLHINTFSLPLENKRGHLWIFWMEYFWLVFTWGSLLSVNDFTLSSFSINGTIWCNNWQLLNIRSRSCEYYIYTENENLNVNQAHLINVWTTYLILNLALIGDTWNVLRFSFLEKMISKNQENM